MLFIKDTVTLYSGLEEKCVLYLDFVLESQWWLLKISSGRAALRSVWTERLRRSLTEETETKAERFRHIVLGEEFYYCCVSSEAPDNVQRTKAQRTLFFPHDTHQQQCPGHTYRAGICGPAQLWRSSYRLSAASHWSYRTHSSFVMNSCFPTMVHILFQ